MTAAPLLIGSCLQRVAHILVTLIATVLLSLFPTLPVNARADQKATLSLQGFSGILNTPTGHVQAEGSINALYSNQKERYPNKLIPPWQDNYLFSVGMFRFAEIGGRLTAPNSTSGGLTSDLSANAKISSAPLTAHLPLAPVVALGIQDMGGGSSLFRSTYLAASADPLPWMRLSAGYGGGPDRMKGAFGGVELKAHDWVTLLGEYDTRDTNAGLRLTAPPLPWFPASLTFTGKSALNRSSNLDIAFGLTLPLDTKKTGPTSTPSDSAQSKPLGAEENSEPSIQNTKANSPKIVSTSDPDIHKLNAPTLSSIRSRLIDAGFASVRVGVLDKTVLVVEYENVRYNHNELDAIGVVAGIVTSVDLKGFDTLCLVVKRKGLRMMQVRAPLKAMQSWLAGGADATAPSLFVDDDTSSVDAVQFIGGDSNPDWLRPSLLLYPGLQTYVGTEFGVFDYLLSVKPDLQVTAWKGGVLNARWDLPVAWSEEFNDHRRFAPDRKKSMMDRLMLFQGINLAPGLIANLGGGMILHNIYGTLNEMTWSPGSGMHRFRLVQAYAHNSDNSTNKKVALGSYRMYLAPMDLFLEGTAGRFWGEDTGGLVTVKRFFGDTSVELYYKNTETLAKKRWQAAGMQFKFPLTPRRDMKRAPLQIRGTEEWSFAQETVLAISGQKSNDLISASLGIDPLPPPNINRSYLNRDRLNEDYIQSHKNRIKEAWLTFRNSLSSSAPKF